jgi:Holliday junction resolvasome RuvABC endonuclease subunit
MKIRILALDMKVTGTGWAESGGDSGVKSFSGKSGDSPGMKWIRFESWLTNQVVRYAPDVIVYEQAHHRGRAPTQYAYTMIGIVEKVAADRGIEVANKHSSEIKKHATGKGRASKEQMIEAAEANWWGKEIKSDDEADALWLLDLMTEELEK